MDKMGMKPLGRGGKLVCQNRRLAEAANPVAGEIPQEIGEKCRERIVRGLLRFAHRLGEPAEDGSIRIPPLSQQTISEYVGTSREIVTLHMNQLRQQGLMRYSRKGINIYTDALSRQLNQEEVRHAAG